MSQIFISYEWGRRDLVCEIVNHLKASHKIWIDKDKMIPGERLHETIQDGINNSEIVLAFVTLAYCKSRNCQLEIQYANRVKKKIVYIVLERLGNVEALPNGMGLLLAENLCFNTYDPEWTKQNMDHYIGKLIDAIKNVKNDKSMFVSF